MTAASFDALLSCSTAARPLGRVSIRHEEGCTVGPRQQRLVRLINVVPHMVWSTTPDGRLKYGNATWSDLIGSQAGASVETALAGRIHANDRERRAEQWRQALRRKQPYEIEYRLKSPDNPSGHWYIERGMPVREARDQKITGWVVTATSIDRHKRAEEELREALSRRDEFFSVLAHELRNPLAPIANALEVLAREAREPATAVAARGIIQRQLLQLTRLVDDLLDVSRASSGRIVLQTRSVDLLEVLEVATESARPIVELRKQVLTVTKNQAPFRIVADPVRLGQVLTNLLINAAKYTPPGGHISVSLQREDSLACIRVRDDGIGIAPEQISEVFELFSQASTNDEQRTGGLGVGLAVARQLVMLHGGTIVARSEGLGRGTEFTIRLPSTQLTAAQ